MLIQTADPKPSEEMVHQLGQGLAKHLVEQKEKSELPELRAAQDFQENVVAKQNERGFRGAEGIGQCVARMDVGLFNRIMQKHKLEIAADSKRFWLVTCPKLYPNLGIKPHYIPKTGTKLRGGGR